MPYPHPMDDFTGFVDPDDIDCDFCGKPVFKSETWNFGGKGGWDVCEDCALIGECDCCGKKNVARRAAGPVLACDECQS